MLLACIADDFTGATDLANTLTRGGMRTLLTVGVPAAEVSTDAQAVVVALKTRSIAPADAVAQSLAAFAWLRKRGAPQFLLKICSTFDSRFATEPRGNIGPVGEALRLALGSTACVPVCPAFPATGRTVYRGHLFVGDALLSESGMAAHPITPMTDANLVRVLQMQCAERVGLVPWPAVQAGAAAIATQLQSLAQQGHAFAIVDALSDDDLRALGGACDAAEVPLLIGGSGIALGLPARHQLGGSQGADAMFARALPGPAVLLAGSCSTATRAQVDAYRRHAPVRAVDPARLAEPAYVAETVDWCVAQSAPPLVASSAAPDEVTAWRQRWGDDLASRMEAFFAALALALHAAGVRRFVVAGGETAGAVVGALGLRQMQVGPEIDPGVPAMRAVGDDPQQPVALALKSGNFGAVDFFARALRHI